MPTSNIFASPTPTVDADDSANLSHIQQSVQRLRLQRIHVEKLRAEMRDKDRRIADLEADAERARRSGRAAIELQQEAGRCRAQMILAEDRARRSEEAASAERIELRKELEMARARETRAREMAQRSQDDAAEAQNVLAAECQRLRTECGRQKAQLEQECVARREQAEYHSQLTSELEHERERHSEREARHRQREHDMQRKVDELLADKAETEGKLRTLTALTGKQTTLIEERDVLVSKLQAELEARERAQRSSVQQIRDVEHRLELARRDASEETERLSSELREAREGASELSAELKALRLARRTADERATAAEHKCSELSNALSQRESDLSSHRNQLASSQGNFEEQLARANELDVRLADTNAQLQSLHAAFTAFQERVEQDNNDRAKFSQARLALLSEFCQEEQAMHEVLGLQNDLMTGSALSFARSPGTPAVPPPTPYAE